MYSTNRPRGHKTFDIKFRQMSLHTKFSSNHTVISLPVNKRYCSLIVLFDLFRNRWEVIRNFCLKKHESKVSTFDSTTYYSVDNSSFINIAF